jgi:hypothetical protein
MYPKELKERSISVPFTRKLSDKSRKLTYRSRQGEFKFPLHWGQRKLLLSEIEFLTDCFLELPNATTVVYAGAAPGTHIPYLSGLFPTYNFVLYDPGKFNIQESDRIRIHNTYFTDDVARGLKNTDNTLFISDIRRSPEGDSIEDKIVMGDMNAQQVWHDLIRPARSMLKFRMPYDHGRVVYLEGDVYFQAWAPQSSSETRLVTSSHSLTVYNIQDYEDKLFRFNTITRSQDYPHEFVGYNGLDNCYDCRTEVEILKKYINVFGGEVRKMTTDITQTLGKHRSLLEFPHGVYPELSFEEKLPLLMEDPRENPNIARKLRRIKK